jgi:phosphatidylserine/phosphatidylglycerophosphate/cardiolipin synthase-like enzyme
MVMALSKSSSRERGSEYVYCTWAHKELLPPALKSKFRDLDHFIRELSASAEARLLIVMPYLSPDGMKALKGVLAAAAQKGVWIRLLTGDLADARGRNRRSLRELIAGPDGAVVRQRLRVLVGSEALSVFFHAKLVIADGRHGYLGSANLSWRGLSKNFEVGTSLSPIQADSLERLISYFEAQGMIVDHTEAALT